MDKLVYNLEKVLQAESYGRRHNLELAISVRNIFTGETGIVSSGVGEYQGRVKLYSSLDDSGAKDRLLTDFNTNWDITSIETSRGVPVNID